jgi:C4-dicarboxylate-specific signal transduction histidine kinase
VHALTDVDERALRALSEDIRRVADGTSDRVDPTGVPELDAIAEAVNRLAARAAADRDALRANIESLDTTNRELRAARDQVVRAARLASVGTLAAGIAHEVGNPLGAILGFVDVARGRAERAGADTELLDAVRDEARRIDRIVRGLLDYARASDAEDEARPVEAVVARVRDLLERQGKLTEVHASWSVGGELSLMVEQPAHLEQVLVNLLLNAVHAVRGEASPRIVIEAWEEEGELRRMAARREDDPPELNYLHRRRLAADDQGVASVGGAERVTVLQISDNGPGIPEDAIDRVFDPFYTTKEPGEGTGLGLSICARLVEGMGGSIEADRSEAGGACFRIRLPMTYHGGDLPEERTTEST